MIKRRHRKLTLVFIITGLFFSFHEIVQSEKSMALVKGGTLTTIDPVTKARKEVRVNSFLIDRNLVTVADFERFVKATGYRTEAEKFGNAAVFDDEVHDWKLVDGADFRHPRGKDKPKAAPDHPVTQVSWNDAVAYAQWAGKRLPTQWEWEHAARNGESSGPPYAWGKDLVIAGKYKANTWQGSFPYHNTVEDGYPYTSPVGAFGASKLGLTDMGGNVWQWCQDSIEPTAREKELDPAMRRVTRGGSFLCDPMVCHGFQVTGRASSTPESSLMHTGFRCVKDTN
jgi:sulfatase modifying factor 1